MGISPGLSVQPLSYNIPTINKNQPTLHTPPPHQGVKTTKHGYYVHLITINNATIRFKLSSYQTYTQEKREEKRTQSKIKTNKREQEKRINKRNIL